MLLLSGDFIYKQMKRTFYTLYLFLVIAIIYEVILTFGFVLGHNKA